MAYSRKLHFSCYKSIGEIKKKKVLKIIQPEKYLVVSIKTLNLRKQIIRQNVKVLRS